MPVSVGRNTHAGYSAVIEPRNLRQEGPAAAPAGSSAVRLNRSTSGRLRQVAAATQQRLSDFTARNKLASVIAGLFNVSVGSIRVRLVNKLKRDQVNALTRQLESQTRVSRSARSDAGSDVAQRIAHLRGMAAAAAGDGRYNDALRISAVMLDDAEVRPEWAPQLRQVEHIDQWAEMEPVTLRMEGLAVIEVVSAGIELDEIALETAGSRAAEVVPKECTYDYVFKPVELDDVEWVGTFPIVKSVAEMADADSALATKTATPLVAVFKPVDDADIVAELVSVDDKGESSASHASGTVADASESGGRLARAIASLRDIAKEKSIELAVDAVAGNLGPEMTEDVVFALRMVRDDVELDNMRTVLEALDPAQQARMLKGFVGYKAGRGFRDLE